MKKPSHYVDGFAEAIVNAYLHGKKSVIFDHTCYAVSAHIGNVLEDIRNGSCKIVVKEIHR